jgi:hypothetical protein
MIEIMKILLITKIMILDDEVIIIYCCQAVKKYQSTAESFLSTFFEARKINNNNVID